MEIRTSRWDDPPQTGDGQRILICRYRPRALPKSAETWDLWLPNLGPSKALHAAVYGKIGSGISWTIYRAHYLSEMRLQSQTITDLAKQVASGKIITLLCSSQCVREDRCHRSLLRQLILTQAQALIAQGSTSPPSSSSSAPAPL